MKVIKLQTDKYIRYTDGTRSHTPEYYYYSMLKSRVGSVSLGGMTNIDPRYNAAATPNMLDFVFFKSWCQSQIGFNNLDKNNRRWQLDKDICGAGSLIYSEENCAFVPQEVNCMFQPNRYKFRDASAKEMPLGITLHNGIYTSGAGSSRSLSKEISIYYSWRISHLTKLLATHELSNKVILNINQHIVNLQTVDYHFIGNI